MLSLLLVDFEQPFLLLIQFSQQPSTEKQTQGEKEGQIDTDEHRHRQRDRTYVEIRGVGRGRGGRERIKSFYIHVSEFGWESKEGKYA